MQSSPEWLTLCTTNAAEREALWPALADGVRALFPDLAGLRCHPACLPLDGRAMTVFSEGARPGPGFLPVLGERAHAARMRAEPVSVHAPFVLQDAEDGPWRMRVERFVRVNADDEAWVVARAESGAPRCVKVPRGERAGAFLARANRAGDLGVVTRGTAAEPTVVLFVCEVLGANDDAVPVARWVREDCFVF